MKQNLLRLYWFALAASAVTLLFVGLNKGGSALLTALILAALEITFSFDNAVVNARVLQRLSKGWQTVFMTAGIAVAVFGVRVLLPIVIVAVSAHTSFGNVVDLVLHRPEEYGYKLSAAHHLIAAFGGLFLLMLFLDFVFTERKIRWLDALETKLAKIGKAENSTVTVSVIILLATTQWLAEPSEKLSVLLAGLTGLMVYLVINAADGLISHEEVQRGAVATTFKAGLVGLLYLELIDASFSLDGVVGAFAITNSVLLIAAGLGIGALFVRSMTIHLLRRGTLARYKYLEHGAHYAIGILALLLILSVRFHIHEAITGGAGVLVIALALFDSYREARQEST